LAVIQEGNVQKPKQPKRSTHRPSSHDVR
jgi:hypothetical protein